MSVSHSPVVVVCLFFELKASSMGTMINEKSRRKSCKKSQARRNGDWGSNINLEGLGFRA